MEEERRGGGDEEGKEGGEEERRGGGRREGEEGRGEKGRRGGGKEGGERKERRRKRDECNGAYTCVCKIACQNKQEEWCVCVCVLQRDGEVIPFLPYTHVQHVCGLTVHV